MQANSSAQSSSFSIYRLAAKARFFTASLLAHVVIVIVAGSSVMFHREAPPPDFMATTDAIVSEQQASEPAPAGSQAPKLEPPPPTVSPSLPRLDALVSTATTNAFKLDVAPPGTVDLGKARSIGGPGVDLSKAIGNGLGKDAMARMGGTSMVKFFGNAASVQAVVFVVDISGSMISGTKSAKSYEELEDEIKRVIRKLDSRTLFGIVTFSRDATLYKEQLVVAAADEKQRAINWLRKQSPIEMTRTDDEEEKQRHHGTRADRGLEAAFKLKPDTIFFISDGEPSGANPGEVLKMVTHWQKAREKPAAINAVAYLADGGQKFMGDLATQNGGNFREINPERSR